MDNLSVLREMFPQVDQRIIRATLLEDKDDLDKAIQFIRSEVLEEEAAPAELVVSKPEVDKEPEEINLDAQTVDAILEQAKAEKENLAQMIDEVVDLRLKADEAEAALREAQLQAKAASENLREKVISLHKLLVLKRDDHAMLAGEILAERATLSLEAKKLPSSSALRATLASRIAIVEKEGRFQMKIAQQFDELEARTKSIAQEFQDLNLEAGFGALLESEPVEESDIVRQSEAVNELSGSSPPPPEVIIDDSSFDVVDITPLEVENVVDSVGGNRQVWDSNALAQAWENVNLSPEFVSTLSSQDYGDRELQSLVNSVQSLSNSMNNSVNANHEEMMSKLSSSSSSSRSSTGSWHFVEDAE